MDSARVVYVLILICCLLITTGQNILASVPSPLAELPSHIPCSLASVSVLYARVDLRIFFVS